MNACIHSYITRRWDLQTLFCSAVMAICLGSAMGLIFSFILPKPPQNFMISVNWQLLNFVIMVVTVLLIVAISIGLYKVMRQNYDMCRLFIRLKAKELGQKYKRLKDVLPKEYIDSKGAKS